MVNVAQNIRTTYTQKTSINFGSSSLKVNQGCVLNQIKQQEYKDFPVYQNCFEKVLHRHVNRLIKSAYSKNAEVRAIEEEFASKGTNIRFKDNLQLATFMKNGLGQIEKAGYKLPKNFLFVNQFVLMGAGGAATRFREPLACIAPILLSSNILKNSRDIEDRYSQGLCSTNNIHHTILHEAGHWRHFQLMPSLQQCMEIWANADDDLISKEVSKRAVSYADGTEFAAEVFAGLVDGKKYSDHVMDIYKQLHRKSNLA